MVNGMIYGIVLFLIHTMKSKQIKVTTETVWEYYLGMTNHHLLTREDIEGVVVWYQAQQKATMD